MQKGENCRQLLSSLSDYIDGTLEEQLCAKLEKHMEGCEDCRIVVDTLRKTIYLYHASAQPASVPADVKRRLYQRLDLEEFMDV
jgi:predicted anti-sigma-YlaC factor YlaD